MEQLAGKVALITGAASGIGRGLAEALGAEGMRLVIADIDAERLQETGEALAQGGVTFTNVCEVEQRVLDITGRSRRI